MSLRMELAGRGDGGGSPDPVTRGLGHELHDRMRELYPICRSITGPGVRQTLDLVRARIPIEVHAVASGTQVFDWTVNDEWTVRDAYVADADGRRVIDFRAHNLHLMSYSAPVSARLSLAELRPHLHSLPDRPDWIPYRTSYYHRDWGFCLPHRQLEALGPGPYDVVVDSTIEPGVMNYGELMVPGESSEEVLVSAHVCHPSLANDNLSGIVVATELAATLLARERRRLTYRFVFAPGTIGSLLWLSRNPDVWPRVRHGLVLTGLGGGGPLVYKQTRRADALVDRAASHVVRRRGGEVRAYSPYGYDERQYNAVGFGLDVGRLSRTPHGEFGEYHTSADDLSFVTPAELAESYAAALEVLDVLEADRRHTNLSPYGEPQLGRRGLYPSTGGKSASDTVMAMLWMLAHADGEHSTLDVAELADLPFERLADAASTLREAGLLAAED